MISRTSDLIPLRETALFETFSEPTNETYADHIFVMSKLSARVLWKSHIDETATTYFGLGDSSWLVLNPKRRLGDWTEAYNRQEYGTVTTLLERLPLPQGREVAFCANANTVLVASWQTFCLAWFGFISISDESPIILPREFDREHEPALIFTPRGAIWRVSPHDPSATVELD